MGSQVYPKLEHYYNKFFFPEIVYPQKNHHTFFNYLTYVCTHSDCINFMILIILVMIKIIVYIILLQTNVACKFKIFHTKWRPKIG